MEVNVAGLFADILILGVLLIRMMSTAKVFGIPT